MVEIKDILKDAKEREATDVHIKEMSFIYFRIGGGVIKQEFSGVSREQILEFVNEKTDLNIEKINKELDFSFSDMAIKRRIRGSLYKDIEGIALALRFLPIEVPDLDFIGMPKEIRKKVTEKSGLILVTGPTGSGKTTTTAAMLNHINTLENRHILTIEDPIEYIHQSKLGLFSQREVGVHTKGFQEALKASLREDPDVIFIGELRDQETIHSAVELAETGHLVIATTHTNSAMGSIDRLIMGVDSNLREFFQTTLSSVLILVVAQRLFSKAGNATELMAVFEFMVCNTGISSAIREGRVDQLKSLMQIGREQGMILMEDAIRIAIEQGKINIPLGYEGED